MNKLVLIDGNSILNRAYYAMPPLNDREGRNVNAVYGFMSILLKVLSDYKPTHIAVAFDKKGKNFRHKLYELYKANRKGMPDDLASQMPILMSVLETMNIEIVGKEGVEADDVIGTLAKRFDDNTFIVSGDKDLLQLIDDTTTVLLTKKGISEVETVDEKYLKEVFHLTPKQVIDYKSLRGDTSDNIPGVKGIGEKTAMSLIEEYSNLDNIYNNVEKIKGSLKEKLVNDKETAYLSYQLATIKTDVDIDCSIEDCAIFPFSNEVVNAFEKLDFNSLIKRLDNSSITAVDKVNSATVNIENIVISEVNELTEKVKFLQKANLVAVNFDKNIHFAVDEKINYEIEISDNFLDGMSFDTVIKIIKPLLESDVEKIVYDAKSLKRSLNKFGIDLPNTKWDLSIMQYLLEYRANKDFLSLANKYNVPTNATGMFIIAKILKEKLISTETIHLYNDIELPLMQVLYEMETYGVKVDVKYLNSLHEQFSKEIELLTAEAQELAGEKFNVMSPKQLATILFEKLMLAHGKKTKTGYSTDNDVLNKIVDAHPIVPLIIKIRQLSKLNGTYIEGLLPLISDKDLIHTNYNQTLTSTGRLSSSEPNLQNIPVRDDIGKDLRKMFIPQNDILISADYSQIELRLLADFSNDENLIDSFNSGKDIHRKVASEIFGIPSELVTDKMRRTAKAVNFGIIYGISDFGLSENVGISVSSAREYIKKYFETYPTIKAYLESLVDQAKSLGYVTTISGRRRIIPEISSSNYQIRSFGERAAMNMPLQGSAADIIKIAMINVSKQLEKQKLKSKLIMQVHDELIIDAVIDEKEKVENLLKEEMENAIKLKVKLTVNIESGVNLYESK